MTDCVGYGEGLYGADVYGGGVCGTPLLEIAFSADATAEPTAAQWIPVTDYVRNLGFDVQPSSRQRELDRFEPGRMSLTLDNSDRRFDPTYSSSPYYPNVLPLRHIRLALDGSYIFRGFVDGFPQAYPVNGQDATVPLNATDVAKVMNRLQLPRSVWEREVSLLTPRVWYRLGDVPGTMNPIDSGPNGYHATVAGHPNFGQQGVLPPNPIETGVTFEATSDKIVPPNTVVPAGANWTIEWVFQREPNASRTVGSDGEAIFRATDPGQVGQITINFGTAAGNPLIVFVDTDAVNFASITGPTGLLDGRPHHGAVVRSWNGSTGSVTLYVDGVASGSGAVNVGTALSGVSSVAIGHYDRSGTGFDNSNFAGTLQEFLIHDSALSASDIANHASWALTPDAGITTGQAVSRALSDAGVDTSMIEDGLTVLGPHSLGGPVLEFCQRMAENEQGTFFIGGDGIPVFHGRDWFVTSPGNVSQATWGDESGELPYSELTFEQDDTFIFNEARVGRENGTVFTISDNDSQLAYLKKTYEKTDLLDATDESAKAHGERVIARFKDPRTEIRSLTFYPEALPSALWAEVETRRPGDLITVNRRPPGGGLITKLCRIQSIKHSGEMLNSWKTIYELSSFEEIDQTAIWDSSLWDGTDPWG